MKFWDASAIIPLCLEEPRTALLERIATDDPVIVVWWGTVVECHSAFARIRREGVFTRQDEDEARAVLEGLRASWVELVPSERIRDGASRSVLLHPLRAADSLQLAASIFGSGNQPRGLDFVCLDSRLLQAARNEGFTILPQLS